MVIIPVDGVRRYQVVVHYEQNITKINRFDTEAKQTVSSTLLFSVVVFARIPMTSIYYSSVILVRNIIISGAWIHLSPGCPRKLPLQAGMSI